MYYSVEENGVFALLGVNGAGKTTSIKMMLSLVRPTSGEIQIKENARVGYSPETPFFPPYLTAREALNYYGLVQGMKKTALKEEIPVILQKVGLVEHKIKIKNYSKGMLQRLALAQALLGDPQLLILAEPTAGLDALGRLAMLQLIHNLKDQGKTIGINSHILNDIERVCDRSMIMKDGNVIGTWDKNEEHSGKCLEEIFVEMVMEG